MWYKIKKIYVGTNLVRPSWWTPWSNTKLYYSFDNDIASTSYDSSGWWYNGSWNSDSWTYTTGKVWKCTQLTATSTKYLSIPTSLTYPTTNFTISFLVKYTSVSADNAPRAIFSKWNGSGSSTNAYVYIYERVWKIWVDIPYNATLFLTSWTYNDGNRHSVILTKSWNTYNLYIDWTNIWSTTNSFSLHWWSNTQWLIWKNNNGNVWLYWDLDEFIIEDIAWNSSKISKYIDGINL